MMQSMLLYVNLIVFEVFCLIRRFILYIALLRRFKGELFGVGTNHTKHKTKYPSTTSLNGMTQNGYPALQYNSAVHYPPSLSGTMMHNAAAGNNFGYEEGYN